MSTLTAFGLAVEIGDWHRFTGSSIDEFVGLTLSKSSSGQSRSLGSITKTGNAHARRLLVEAGWHHRRRYVVRATMTRRWDRVDAAARTRGHEGNQPMPSRWQRFDARSKRSSVANVAIARQLAGGAGRWPSGPDPNPNDSVRGDAGSEREERHAPEL